MTSIECRAAVAWAPNEPLSLETVTVAAPGPGEVRVRVLATGVCHTDAQYIAGLDAEAVWPVILGAWCAVKAP
jgi:S-(hydroxymethyl)glutathione dehydrogenase/alcohol dehydrogenase